MTRGLTWSARAGKQDRSPRGLVFVAASKKAFCRQSRKGGSDGRPINIASTPERLAFLDETLSRINMAPLRGWRPRDRSYASAMRRPFIVAFSFPFCQAAMKHN
jgi:hypothetical protein